MHPAKLVRTASFLLIAASFPVAAAEPEATPVAPAPAVAVSAPIEKKQLLPWRGSNLGYSHTFSALSLSKAADPWYNPYYVQTLSLRPEWHFTPHLFAGAKLELEQELTVSDDTNHVNEIVLSDLLVDLGTDGYQEPRSGVRASGTLRLVAPFSKLSTMQTRLFSFGPGVTLSRKFPVLAGLTLSYAARYTQRFHRYTTSENAGFSIGGCNILRDQTCDSLISSGRRNIRADLVQGPKVSLNATGALHLDASLQISDAWLYPLSPLSAGTPTPLNEGQDVSVRVSTTFALGVAYDLTRELSLSLSASTLNPQLGDDGLRRTPFFNRFTTVSLDVALDVEALLSRI